MPPPTSVASPVPARAHPRTDPRSDPRSDPRTNPRTSPIDSARRRRAWDDAPLRLKVTLLVMTATVAGVLLGMVEARLGHLAWPLGVGLIAVMLTLVHLGQRWAAAPVERLLGQWESIRRDGRPGLLRALPVTRCDEVGQLARALQEVSSSALRDSYEARQLRRTLDHRVAAATHAATRQLRQLAMRDALTDLGNRRFLEENLEALVGSVLASKSELACVMIDVDGFKQVNDTRGHAAGDELLVFLAQLLRARSRREDYVVRLGGDEFAVLMPGCNAVRAAEYAGHVQALFRQQAHTAFGEEPRTDLSMGIAALTRDGLKTGEELLAKADEYLYAAKRAGKGRVVGA